MNEQVLTLDKKLTLEPEALDTMGQGHISSSTKWREVSLNLDITIETSTEHMMKKRRDLILVEKLSCHLACSS